MKKETRIKFSKSSSLNETQICLSGPDDEEEACAVACYLRAMGFVVYSCEYYGENQDGQKIARSLETGNLVSWPEIGIIKNIF